MHITSLSWSLCVLNFPRISLIYLIFFLFFFSIALFSFVFKNSSKPNLGPLHRHTRRIPPCIPAQTRVLAQGRSSKRKHSFVQQKGCPLSCATCETESSQLTATSPSQTGALRKTCLRNRDCLSLLTRGCNVQPDAGMYVPRVVTLPPQELDHLFPERMTIHQCGRMSAAQPVATSGPTPCHLDYSNVCLILVYSHLRRPSCFCQ